MIIKSDLRFWRWFKVWVYRGDLFLSEFEGMASEPAVNMPGAGAGRIPGPPYNLYYNQNRAQFNPTMAVIIIVLVGGCFLLGFISVFVRKCMAGGAGAAMGTTTDQRSRSWRSKTHGLEKAVVGALPIVCITDLGEKFDSECPVCLTEFEPEDSLRLLPACGHVFHQECIDAWFESHSTCPLCRASLTADATAGNSSVDDQLPVVTVVEVSENGDSDIELQPVSDSPTPREEARISDIAVGAAITREDERNSARGTLSRNSQSFKRAVRGTTALEKAASIDSTPGISQSTSKPASSTARKPPAAAIHRSTSLGSDLIALRNHILASRDQQQQQGSTTLSRSRSAAPTQAASSSWFTRARSMDLGSVSTRDSSRLSREQSRENWSTIDLESGKQPGANVTTKGESSSRGPAIAGDRTWSLASLRGAMFPLNRSTSDTSDTSSHVNSNLPV